ncbi:MAG TPA: Vps62-related protein [Vicinamibacteria bacterium]|nr:Vps62-related protein [Vicinamibacteria bacterium]
MSRAVAATFIALQAAFCAVPAPAGGAEPAPVLVHAGAERHPAASVAGSGIPGTGTAGPDHAVYARRAGDWIQYWIWFEANPQDRGVLRSGRHAGDWELVQYRADGSEAVYAQHSGAERCSRRDVEFRGGRPVVYVANGSHAAYFRAGTRDRMWPDPNDEADGRGSVQRPIAVPVTEGAPPWMRFRGRWGPARAGWFPPEQSSPRGPAFQGVRWDDPGAFARSARPCTGRRCVAVGACDGTETALSAGALALAVAAGFGWWRRRRRTAAG